MTPEQSAELARPVRVLQTIVGALILGLVAWLVVAHFVGPTARRDGRQPPAKPVITYLAAAYGAVTLVAALVVPPVLAGAGRRKIAAGTFTVVQPGRGDAGSSEALLERTGDAGRLCYVLFPVTIVGAAVLESGGLLAGVAYLLEGESLAVGVAVVLLLALAMRFPTQARVEQWIDEQLELIQQGQSFGA